MTSSSVWNTNGTGSLLDAFGKAERTGLGGRDKVAAVQKELQQNHHHQPQPAPQYQQQQHNQSHHQQLSNEYHQQQQQQQQQQSYQVPTPRGGAGGGAYLNSQVSSGRQVGSLPPHQQQQYMSQPRGGGSQLHNHGNPHSSGAAYPTPPLANNNNNSSSNHMGSLLDQLEIQRRGGSEEMYLGGGGDVTPNLGGGAMARSRSRSNNNNNEFSASQSTGGMVELNAQTEWSNVPAIPQLSPNRQPNMQGGSSSLHGIGQKQEQPQQLSARSTAPDMPDSGRRGGRGQQQQQQPRGGGYNRPPPAPIDPVVQSSTGGLAFDANMFGNNTSGSSPNGKKGGGGGGAPGQQPNKGKVASKKTAATAVNSRVVKASASVGGGFPRRPSQPNSSNTYSESPLRTRVREPQQDLGFQQFQNPSHHQQRAVGPSPLLNTSPARSGFERPLSLDPNALLGPPGAHNNNVHPSPHFTTANTPPVLASQHAGEDDPYTPSRHELTGPVVVDDEDRDAIEELFATDDFAQKFNAAAEARGQQVAREQRFEEEEEHQQQPTNSSRFSHYQQNHQSSGSSVPRGGGNNNNRVPNQHHRQPQQQQQQQLAIPPQYQPRQQQQQQQPQLGYNRLPAGGGPPVCHICSKQLPKDSDVATYLSQPFDPTGPTPRRKKLAEPKMNPNNHALRSGRRAVL